MTQDILIVRIDGVLTVVVMATHRYFAFAGPWITQVADKWKVSWRDFWSTKQDTEFDTQAEAKLYARMVIQRPLVMTNIERDDLYYERVIEADADWRTL